MKTFSILAAIFAFASVVTARRTPDWTKFEKFMKTYHKKYSSKFEELKRFAIFKKNLRVIDARNRDGTIGKHDVNMFTDLEKNEFLQMYTGRANKTATAMGNPVFAGPCPLSSKYKAASGNPVTINWASKGATTPVKNQGQCGSCWAESATEQIETDNYFKTGKLVELSVQQVTSCDTTAGGCEGGWTENAYDYVVNSGGLEPNSVYPYTSGNTQQTGSCKDDKSKAVVKITGCNQISYYDDELARGNETATLGRENVMATAIASTPMSICVDATAFQTYSSGILGASCGTSINHCVQIVGAGKSGSTPYWIVRNSWATSWGEDGYCRVQYGINACGIASDATTSTIA